ALSALVGDEPADDGAPTCREAVDHAMTLLQGDPSRPHDPDEAHPHTRDDRDDARPTYLDEARAAYVDGCAELGPAGRRCVAGASTVAAVDACFADPAMTSAPPPAPAPAP
ncbi:MAG TPA: hypothetical protein VHE35_14795, partial [Kofleriaceae bacterium]|nr:hypothetical protein [Kofleriaceae bacterium]